MTKRLFFGVSCLTDPQLLALRGFRDAFTGLVFLKGLADFVAATGCLGRMKSPATLLGICSTAEVSQRSFGNENSGVVNGNTVGIHHQVVKQFIIKAGMEIRHNITSAPTIFLFDEPGSFGCRQAAR